MSIQSITPLPTEEWRILKQIKLVADLGKGNPFSIGYLLYQRPLSPTYCMKSVPEEERDINYLLNYPQQELFPSDRVDNIILQAVKDRFPGSIVWNHTIIFNVDEERITVLKNRVKEPAQIIITPNPSDASFWKNSHQSFDIWRKEVTIYNDYTRESIQDLYFNGYYDLKDMGVLDELDKVVFI